MCGFALLAPAVPLSAQDATAPSPVIQAQPGAHSAAEGAVQNGVLTPGQIGVQTGALPQANTLLPFTPGQSGPHIISPIQTPTVSPGALTLLELEGRFQQAVTAGGGKAFAEWFADDAVILNNGQPAVQGRGNIAAQANWSPADYQLSWVPQNAIMGPSNDMGFTWGTYVGKSKDKHGEVVSTTGRYITIWRKDAGGKWKVAMDASANEPPAAGDCCTLPKP